MNYIRDIALVIAIGAILRMAILLLAAWLNRGKP